MATMKSVGTALTRSLRNGSQGLRKRARFLSLSVAIAAGFVVSVSACLAAPLDCAHNRCGLLTDGEYGNLIIGRLVQVGTEADMHRVYQWAKAHGYWKSLPNSPVPYQHHVKLMVLALPHALARKPVTVFIQAEEFDSAPLAVGTLVRYSPHGARHEAPPKADAQELALYHGLTGCVATLCRPGNRACFKRYHQGVFTKASGKPVNPKTGAIVPGVARIDPVSLLPAH